MNKREFSIFSSQYVAGFSSFVTQYLKADTGVRYLLYASEDKNHIYIARQSLPIISVDIKIGTAELFGLLPDEDGNMLLDITEIIKANANSASAVDMIIRVTQSNGVAMFSFKIAVAEGRRFDELAGYLSLPQQNYCNLRSLASLYYSSSGSQSYISPPSKIILPINENGTRTKFNNISSILLPIWQQTYGVQNVQISQTGAGIVSSVANNYSPISINIASAQKGRADIRVTGTKTGDIVFEGFNDAQRYIVIRWKCPYIPPLEYRAQGTEIPYTASKIKAVTGMAFFEVLEIKQATNVISLENTASYMPNLIEENVTIKIVLKNLNAYDYIYYSQILLSDNIEYCLAENFSASSNFTYNFQPAKIEKTNNIIPVGNGVYNLEFTLIVKEND